MDTVAVSKSLITASASCIATSQSLAAAGNLVINGASAVVRALGPFAGDITVAALDTQRRVQITSAGDDSARSFTVTGWRQGGQLIREVLAGTKAGSVATTLDFLNVGTVAVDGAIASTVTVGTNGTGSTDWIMPDFHLTPFSIGIVTQLSGSAGWNLETTNDMNYAATPRGPQDPTQKPTVTKIIDGSTIAQAATLNSAITGYRFTNISGTGTLSAQTQQAGIIN